MLRQPLVQAARRRLIAAAPQPSAPAAAPRTAEAAQLVQMLPAKPAPQQG